MNNYVQPGKTLDYTHTAVVASGVAVLIGTVLVIPGANAGVGVPFPGTIDGVYNIVCATGTAWTMNTPVYWDDTNKRVTTTPTNNTKIGMVAAPKVAGAAVGTVKLIPAV